MKTKSDELYARLNRVIRSPAEKRKAADLMRQDVVQFWLNGLTTKQNAAACGITVQHVNRLLAPERKLLADGGYAADIQRKAAKGVTNVPTLATKLRPGRPPRPISDKERAMREEFAEKHTSIAELARKHGIYPQLVRHILGRAPSLLPK